MRRFLSSASIVMVVGLLATAMLGSVSQPALAGCLGQKLVDLLARHYDATNAVSYLKSMNVENTDWVLETVRIERDADPIRRLDPHFRVYLENVILTVRDFDQTFRSGNFSSQLTENLKREHVLMVRGEGEEPLYQGTTSVGRSPQQNRIVPGRLVIEQSNMVLSTAIIDLKRPGTFAGEWNGPGSMMIPPPDLTGPFPRQGETWELWFPEIAEAAAAKGINPASVMPTNFGKFRAIKHQYPRFVYQRLYLDRMAAIMQHIENCLLRTHPNTPLKDVLVLLADYYQVGINAHLFSRVNNSLLMAQVNYLLHYMGLRGIPHRALDYYALYKVPADFRSIFIEAVRERNPGIWP